MRSNSVGVLLGVIVGLTIPSGALAADAKAGPAKLTVKQIVERHVAARGGLQAWHGIQSIVLNGQMDVGFADSVSRSERYVRDSAARRGRGARALPPRHDGKEAARKQVQVPFVLEVKRPDKSRIEIEFGGKRAIQVYDGSAGWLLRPYLNRDDWVPFTAEQVEAERGRDDVDGPLIDYAAKGGRVELVGVERVDGREAYKLKLTRKSGVVQLVWIDAKSFLDVKVEGKPRRMDGRLRKVWVAQRDFRSVQGVMVPFVLETSVDGSVDTHKTIVEKVAVNRPLDDALFTKPRS